MTTDNGLSQAERILSELDCLTEGIENLADESKARIAADLVRIRSRADQMIAAIGDLSHSPLPQATNNLPADEETRFRAVFQNAAFAILLARLEDGVIVDLNPAWEKLFGIQREAALGRTSVELGTVPDEAARLQGYAELRSTGCLRNYPMTYRTETRGAVTVSVNADVVSINGTRYIMSTMENITERVQVEKELIQLKEKAEQSAAQMQAIMDSMTDGLMIVDAHANQIYHNPVSLALHGYRSIEEVQHPADGIAVVWEVFDMEGRLLPPEAWPMARALLGERFSEYEVRVKRTDTGKSFIGSYNGTPVYDPNGQVILAIIHLRDITESKQAEEALRASEEKFAKAFRSSPVAMAITRRSDGQYLDVNDSLCRLIGYRHEEMIGRTTIDLGIYGDAEERRESLCLLLKQESMRNVERTIQNRYGEPVSAVISLEPIQVGGEACLLATLMDITERKRAEEALRESEAMFSTAFRSSPVAMAITRAADGMYIDVNDSHDELLGYAREELLGRTTNEIGIYSSPEEHASVVNMLRNHGRVRNVELRFRMKSGEIRTQLLSLEPFERYGEDCILGTMIDVTERKRAEEELRKNASALRESEAKFRGAFKHAAIGFAMTTHEGRFVDANPAYCALTGYSLEELQTFAFNQLIHPDDYAENMRLNEKMRAGQITDFVVENRYVRKDGQAVWVRKSISQVRDTQNIPKWNVALVEDITERKRAETALRISEAGLRATGAALNERNLALERAQHDLINERNRLMAVMDALPIGLAIYDIHGGVIQANQGFEAVWGSPRPPASSVDDYDLYQAWWVESGERVQAEEWAAALAVQKGETIAGQYIQIQKFDGSTGFILNSGAPVRDERGQVVGGAVAIMEITDRVQAEKALQESQERFRVALSSVPLLVYTCDLELRYTWVYNPQRGFKVEDVLGKRDDEVLPAGAAVELIAAKQMALDTGQSTVQEVKVPFNGQNVYYILTAEPLKDARGNVCGLTCSAIDITTQKRLEIEQEENEMRMEVQRRLMEYREKERQEIARDLHDGPLQLLSGTIFNLQAAKEATQDPLLKLELEQTAHNMKAAIRELRDTMNALRPPAIIRFGLAKSARMHAEDFRDRHPGIKIGLNMIDDQHLLSETARLALFRIYQESLNNIVKHAKASRVWVRTWKKGDHFYLQIRDNGHGFIVPMDLIGHTQIGHYGLAGMKERAEAVGGILTVASEPGKGTKIQVIIPFKELDGQ